MCFLIALVVLAESRTLPPEPLVRSKALPPADSKETASETAPAARNESELSDPRHPPRTSRELLRPCKRRRRWRRRRSGPLRDCIRKSGPFPPKHWPGHGQSVNGAAPEHIVFGNQAWFYAQPSTETSRIASVSARTDNARPYQVSQTPSLGPLVLSRRCGAME